MAGTVTQTPLPQVRTDPAVAVTAGNRRRPVSLFRLGQYVLMIVVLLVSVLPLVWILLTSVKPDSEIVSYPPTILPRTFTLDNFANLFRTSRFDAYLANSIIVATAASALTVIFGACAAYVFTRFEFKFLRGIGELSLFAYMVPPILVLVPIAQIIVGIHLTNNLIALVIIYTALQLPFALWILRSYLQGYTIELEQAAMVDGCTRFGAFLRVVLPQSVPGLVSTAVFTFNACWAEFLFASTLMTSPETLTVPPGTALLIQQVAVFSWGMLMAASVLVAIPVLVLFILLQSLLVGEVGEGAIKG